MFDVMDERDRPTKRGARDRIAVQRTLRGQLAMVYGHLQTLNGRTHCLGRWQKTNRYRPNLGLSDIAGNQMSFLQPSS